MDRRWFAPSMLVGFILGAYFGDFPGESLLMERVYPTIDWVLESAAHPLLFTALASFFLGYIAVPNIVRFLAWRGDRQQFRKRFQEAIRDKGDFHSLANRAYGVWRKGQPQDCPETLDDLINLSLAPCGRCFLSDSLEKIRGTLSAANPYLWQFCLEFYTQIEKSRNDQNYKPKFLSKEECIYFSTIRKELTSFWDSEGEMIFDGVGILFKHRWLRKIKPELQDTSVRLLPYLETALAEQLPYKSVRANYLFRLAKIGYEEWLAANT